MITFNVSHADASKLCKEYVVSMGMAAEHIPPEELLKLKVGEAWGKIDKTVFPLKTWLADQSPDHARATYVIERSRRNYGLDLSAEVPAPVTKPSRPVAVQTPQELPKDEEVVLDPSKVF